MKTFLIDVRSTQEFNEGHLQGALNIPVYDIEHKIQSVTSNKESVIILYCQAESRSIKAKKILEKMGYTNVFILKNGLNRLK